MGCKTFVFDVGAMPGAEVSVRDYHAKPGPGVSDKFVELRKMWLYTLLMNAEVLCFPLQSVATPFTHQSSTALLRREYSSSDRKKLWNSCRIANPILFLTLPNNCDEW